MASTRLAARIRAAAALALGAALSAGIARADGGTWVSGDVHTHTFLTDGSHTEAEVLENALGRFGLDFIANSEHGGLSNRDPTGVPWAGQGVGDTANASNKLIRKDGQMWRWQCLRDVSFSLLFAPGSGLAVQYPGRTVIQGVEWNVPSHEHASVGIVGDAAAGGAAVADFEYQFDASDMDRSREGTLTTFDPSHPNVPPPFTTPRPVEMAFGVPLVKRNKTHADAVTGAAWLQANLAGSAYVVVNHPSRQQRYSAADLRDLIDAAPDVMMGLEGLPGHQKEAFRGGYGSSFKDAAGNDVTYRARTWGGADYMLAKVGGLMDSLWGEGRRFWIFVDSDFHSSADGADFWPGEYARTWINVAANEPRAIVAGMRSGNLFAVHGDLVTALDFSAQHRDEKATMGGKLAVPAGADVKVKIRFKSPRADFDHVDLIVGEVTAPAAKGTPGYASETNPSAHVERRLLASDFEVEEDGWHSTVVMLRDVRGPKFLRLRGTNEPLGSPKLDAEGNPVVELQGDNTKEKALADLWFYANPIFVAVQ